MLRSVGPATQKRFYHILREPIAARGPASTLSWICAPHHLHVIVCDKEDRRGWPPRGEPRNDRQKSQRERIAKDAGHLALEIEGRISRTVRAGCRERYAPSFW